MKWRRILLPVSILLAIALIVWMMGTRLGRGEFPDEITYNFHVRPILSDRCFKCHGPDARQRKASLRLDTEQGLYGRLREDSSQRVIVPGRPENSELFRRISAHDTSVMMPPPSSNLQLTSTEIEFIRRWIKDGAQYQRHWAFVPPQKPQVPEVSGDWPRNEIDHFILDAMQRRQLNPNEEADKERLLKRVSLDLTGLPPAISRQDDFLGDDNADAFERVVDELLADPHYGEKMAIHWLDVARYADTHGYQDDGLRTMWPWRDWVIHAFNKNYSYDKFVTWQLAGDMLPDPDKEMLLATGFNRNHKITQEGGVIDEEYRIEYVTDRTNTFGKAFLALTFECAKCHDHKYDPISQKQYYGTFAFFNQVAEKGYQGDIFSGTPADEPRMRITEEDIEGILHFVNKRDSAKLNVMIMRDSSWYRPTHVLIRGAYDAQGAEVFASTPPSILGFDTTIYQKNRLGLAQWLFSKDNPVTARVFVNRMWEQFFGRGLVKTTGDFGMQGELPTHPELLDWLAVDFVEHGWNIKRLVKQIVMSATYRQSALVTTKKLEQDPENIYLSRAPRIRLTAELARDLVLASSGLLTNEIGGPSVKPYQPKGLWEVATSGRGLTRYVQDEKEDLYRRGMYTFIKRTVPPPSLLIFDASNRDQCEVKRLRTNTPLQALVMMNDPQVNEAARVLAEKLMNEPSQPEAKIKTAFRSVLCRAPAAEEMKVLTGYFDGELRKWGTQPVNTEKLIAVGEYPHSNVADRAALAALMEVVMMIYNMEEAIVRT